MPLRSPDSRPPEAAAPYYPGEIREQIANGFTRPFPSRTNFAGSPPLRVNAARARVGAGSRGNPGTTCAEGGGGAGGRGQRERAGRRDLDPARLRLRLLAGGSRALTSTPVQGG
jgi:hypothetical protein